MFFLSIPARVSAGVLSFAAAANLTGLPFSHPFALVSGAAAAAATSFILSSVSRSITSRGTSTREIDPHAADIGMHWLDAVQAIGKVLRRFSDLALPSTSDHFFIDPALVLLLHRHLLSNNISAARRCTRTHKNVLLEGRHYLDYAVATYGFAMLRLSGLLDPDYNVFTNGGSAEDIAKHILGLREEHVVLCRLGADEMNDMIDLPRHLVALDLEREAIVVAIRGTSSISDVITDLLCENEPFENGYAHSGIKKAAEALLNLLVPTLRDVLSSHPEFTIVVTGHSLGAGSAILLTKLLLRDGFTAKCYAFAPPPVFGPMEEVDMVWSDAVHVFVHLDDIVTRLSLASARSFELQMERIDMLQLTAAEKRTMIQNRDVAMLQRRLQNHETSTSDPRESRVRQLYIPTLRGVNWLVPKEDDSSDEHGHQDKADPLLEREKARQRNEWRKAMREKIGDVAPAYYPKNAFDCFVVPIQFFERMLLTSQCVDSHMTNAYTSAFAGLDLPLRREGSAERR